MANPKKDYAEIFIRTILASILLQDLLDQLEGTNVYRHALKKSAKHLGVELDKMINSEVNNVCGIDDECLYHQIDYQKDLIYELSDIKAEDAGIISEMIKCYKEHPEETLAALKIKLVDKIPEDEKIETILTGSD